MSTRTAYRVKDVLDPVTGETSGARFIVAGDGQVEAVSNAAPRDTPVVDASNLVAIPGLIDSHTHLSLSLPGDEDAQVARPLADRAFRALAYCDKMLAEGVTTIRLVGEPDGLDYALRDAVRRRDVLGPRAVCSGSIIAPSHVYASLARTADGVAEVTHAVRDNIRRGAEWIKLYTTPASRRGDPLESMFSRDEIDAAVACASRAGIPVVAHAHGGKAVDYLLDAGVATIEHGRFLSDEQLRRMAEQNVALCSTVGIGVFSDVESTGKPLEQALRDCEQRIREARACGVTVVPGTDAVHGQLRFELAALEHHGLSRFEALRAATEAAASVVARGDRFGRIAIGRIASGYLADFALLDGNPLASGPWPRVVATIIGGQIAWQSGALEGRPPDERG